MSVLIFVLAVLWFAMNANSFIYRQYDPRNNNSSYKNLTGVLIFKAGTVQIWL